MGALSGSFSSHTLIVVIHDHGRGQPSPLGQPRHIGHHATMFMCSHAWISCSTNHHEQNLLASQRMRRRTTAAQRCPGGHEVIALIHRAVMTSRRSCCCALQKKVRVPLPPSKPASRVVPVARSDGGVVGRARFLGVCVLGGGGLVFGPLVSLV
jgi:hypothetical protein